MQHNLVTEIPDYLDRLNPEQRQAVETTEGPLLVLAGAGTGKTSVLTSRITHIINSNLAYPNQILAVTFTNKAAREMKERVGGMLQRDVSGMWIGTFHSVCVKILRRHAELLGFESNFTILDSDDQVRLLKTLMVEANIDPKKHTPKIVMSVIQGLKDKGKTPDKVDQGFAGQLADGRVAELYAIYQKRMKQINAMDFGDLLLFTVLLFQQNPDVLLQYHGMFKYILVDEYQDTNVVQYLWLRLLAQGSNNICCVGDDDQSIYSWRGAEVGNILRFEKDFENAEIVKLERNYRSTQHILSAASGLIAKNRGRLGKTLHAEGSDKGNQVKVKFLWDGEEEAKFIANEIESMNGSLTSTEKTSLSEVAVLVRAGFQTRAFEERFLTLNIPYKVVGGLRFYERAEIRDACAYIRVLMQPSNDLAFERIINIPKRGIGKSSLEQLYHNSREQGISLYESTRQMVSAGALATKARNALKDLMHQFDTWGRLLQDHKHEEVVQQMLDESGYIGMWKEQAQKENSPEALGRLENLGELVRAISEFEGLEDFLDHISLVMENEEANATGEMVNIMTLHAAKGLEFDMVFLPGWEEGLFPHQRSLDESGENGLEEERRLAYVGITRARKTLFISHAANRRIYNQWQNSIPSRFLNEIPEEHVEQLPSNLNIHKPADDNKHDRWQGRSGGFNEKSGGGFRSQTKDSVQSSAGVKSERVGERVFHQKFGYGKIVSANGDNLEINFEHTGKKTLKAGFVEKVNKS